MADVDCVVLVIPGRDAVPPPDLPADAPVLDVLQPLEVGLGPVLGHDADATFLDRRDRRPGNGSQSAGAAVRLGLAGEIHVPLVGQIRLDHGAGAIPARHHQPVRLDRFQQSLGLEVGDDARARIEAVETLIRGRCRFVDAGIDGEDVDQRQVVPAADGMVVEVVRGGDLDAAGAECGVDVVVGDDRDQSAGQRQQDLSADQVPVAFVLRMHRDGRVAKQGFRAGGGDDQYLRRRPALAVGDGITDVPERTRFLLADHLKVGDGGVQHRIPVHQPLTAVDQPLFMKAHEHLGHRRRQSLVHGEALARPVGRSAHAAQLARDGVARLGFPLPDPLQEGVPAQIMARAALGGELAFHHHLGGDAGVIGARLP